MNILRKMEGKMIWKLNDTTRKRMKMMGRNSEHDVVSCRHEATLLLTTQCLNKHHGRTRPG